MPDQPTDISMPLEVVYRASGTRDQMHPHLRDNPAALTAVEAGSGELYTGKSADEMLEYLSAWRTAYNNVVTQARQERLAYYNNDYAEASWIPLMWNDGAAYKAIGYVVPIGNSTAIPAIGDTDWTTDTWGALVFFSGLDADGRDSGGALRFSDAAGDAPRKLAWGFFAGVFHWDAASTDRDRKAVAGAWPHGSTTALGLVSGDAFGVDTAELYAVATAVDDYKLL